MPDVFEDNLLLCIQSQGLLDDCGRVLLAVSGGADSVAMAHALARLRTEGRLQCEFVIGHINHCLRGTESDADETFVRQLGDRLGISVVTERVDVPQYARSHKLSIETAARRCRLTCLAGMAKKHNCVRIATAHHADDQAETVIFRLMRGTGFRGLCGIHPVSSVFSGVFVRPLLTTSRDEIMNYCRHNDLTWREDASNQNWAFTRNRIRHGLLPAFSSGPNFTESLTKLTQSAQKLQKQLDKTVETMQPHCIENAGGHKVVWEQGVLQDCPVWIFYEIIRQSLLTLGAGLRHYSQAHFETIREMTGQSRAKADFPGYVEVCVKDGKVILTRTDRPADFVIPDKELKLEIGQSVEFGPWKITSKLLDRDSVDYDKFMESKDLHVEWFDAAKITGPLTVRCRRDGDRFGPIGGKGTKKVARFLQDGQFDTQIRQTAVIIEDTEKILWLAPIRMAEPVKVNRETTQILEIQVDARS